MDPLRPMVYQQPIQPMLPPPHLHPLPIHEHQGTSIMSILLWLLMAVLAVFIITYGVLIIILWQRKSTDGKNGSNGLNGANGVSGPRGLDGFNRFINIYQASGISYYDVTVNPVSIINNSGNTVVVQQNNVGYLGTSTSGGLAVGVINTSSRNEIVYVTYSLNVANALTGETAEGHGEITLGGVANLPIHYFTTGTTPHVVSGTFMVNNFVPAVSGSPALIPTVRVVDGKVKILACNFSFFYAGFV